MAEIDPVILQLRADVAKYRVDVENTTRRVNGQLDSQGKAVVKLERQIAASSSQISSSMKGLAASLAAGFSAREVANMADSYTRFTNQLKVAGLEGDNLAGTQDRLFQVAQRNGVELEAVGTLYSRAAQNQKELGASTADLIDLTRAVSASLRISGTSTNEASGALLQLGQALGSPRVQAEEFNSLLDTMQPLLRQASQYIDGTGGSLAGLTQKIKDTKGPGVSNVELFRAIIRAMSDLEKQAANTTLTISGAFTNLSNAMTKFIGETDSANGSTALVTGALNLLADNLDTVTEALSVLSAVMLGRFVAGMTAGAAATGVASTAIFALQARAIGAATTMEALALAGGTAGRALLAAFGGPVGIAITALTVGLGYLLTKTDDAANASGEYAKAQDDLAKIQDKAAIAAQGVATATGKARAEALANAKALQQETQQYIANAKAAVAAARAKASQAAQDAQTIANSSGAQSVGTGSAMIVGGNIVGQRTDRAARQAQTNLRVAQENLRKAEAEQKRIDGIVNGLSAPPVVVPNVIKGDDKKNNKGPKPKDPGEIARRFADDLAQGEIAIKQAQADAIGTAEARRQLEHDQIEYERARNARQIAADKDLTEAQKTQLLQQNEKIAQAQRQAINADALREAQENQKRAAENQAEYAEDALRADASLATTRQASLEANLRILDSLEKQEKAHLEAQIAAGEIANAEKARADLAKTQAARRTTTAQDHESPLGQYSRGINETDVNDQVEGYVVDELKSVQNSIASGLQKAIGTDDPLISGLINLFIQQVIMKPIAAALAQATQGGGGAGGILGSIIGAVGSAFGGSGSSLSSTSIAGAGSYNFSSFGFSRGGYTGDGGVNDPAGIVHKGEYVVPADSVRRIGVQNLAAMASGRAASMAGVSAARPVQSTTVISAPRFDLKGAVITPKLYADMQRISDESAARAGATSYKQSMKDAPGAVRRAQRFRTT